MGNFRSRDSGRFGGNHRGGFGERRGVRDRGPVTMYQAICSQCGKPCEVPFQPTNGKPVYCNECFGAKRDSESGRGDRPSQRNSDRREFAARPSFNNNIEKGNNEEIKKQLELLNTKMDQLIKIAGSMIVTPLLPKEEKIIEPLPKKSTAVKTKKAVKTVAKKAKK